MKSTIFRTIILGFGGVSLIQYIFWKSLTITAISHNFTFFNSIIIPFFFSLFYCIYEKNLVFTSDTTDGEKFLLAFSWFVEGIIGALISLPQIKANTGNSLFATNFSLMTAFFSNLIFIFSFIGFRKLLRDGI